MGCYGGRGSLSRWEKGQTWGLTPAMILTELKQGLEPLCQVVLLPDGLRGGPFLATPPLGVINPWFSGITQAGCSCVVI